MRRPSQKTAFCGVRRLLAKQDDRTHQINGARLDPLRKGVTLKFEELVKARSDAHAAEIRAARISELEGGGPRDPSRRSVAECCESWLEGRAPSLDPRTAITHAGAVAHIVQGLGDYYPEALSREIVQAWVNEALADEYSPATVRGWLRRLSTVAADLEWRDPTLRIVLPEVEEKENRLTSEQLAKVLAEYRRIDPATYALIVLLAYTGLRFCHASGIKWEDIDEEDGVLRVRRKNILGETRPVSKKKKAPEEIPLPSELLDVLKAHRQAMLVSQTPGVETGYCFPRRSVSKKDGTERWLLLGTEYITDAWHAALKAAGVTERVTIHGLRRTFGDLMRKTGADAMVRRSFTAHANERMQAHYEGVDGEERRKAMEGVAKLVPLKGGA